MYRQFPAGLQTRIFNALRTVHPVSKQNRISTALVISPHMDDAAFSLAGTLKVLASAEVAIRIVNCFTVTRFAPFAAGNSRLSAMTLRRHEDERFLHGLGGKSISEDLGLPDAPARTNRGIRSVELQDPLSTDVVETINLLTEAMDEADSETMILAPLAIGNHTDHYIARQAAIVRYRHCPIAFYEDLPYAIHAKKTKVQSALSHAVKAFHSELQPLLVHWPGDSEWKRQCCSHYKSQISETGIQKIAEYMAANAGERLWASAEFVRNWKLQGWDRPPKAWIEPYFM
jgi:LmbE family N-acetylglucosaminyl deacetylase